MDSCADGATLDRRANQRDSVEAASSHLSSPVWSKDTRARARRVICTQNPLFCLTRPFRQGRLQHSLRRPVTGSGSLQVARPGFDAGRSDGLSWSGEPGLDRRARRECEPERHSGRCLSYVLQPVGLSRGLSVIAQASRRVSAQAFDTLANVSFAILRDSASSSAARRRARNSERAVRRVSASAAAYSMHWSHSMVAGVCACPVVVATKGAAIASTIRNPQRPEGTR